MIKYESLIALAKCRQIARQMRPSRGRDALLDRVDCPKRHLTYYLNYVENDTLAEICVNNMIAIAPNNTPTGNRERLAVFMFPLAPVIG
jgi:hypothetical protein